MTPPPRRRRDGARAVVVTALVAALSATVVGAANCADTGEPAPAVVTLMASKTKPATDAWVVSPNCKVETITPKQISEGNLSLNITAKGIERVVNVPTKLWFVTSTGNPLSQGVDLSKATGMVGTQIIDSKIGSNPGNLIVPASIVTMSIYNNAALTSLENIKFPSGLQTLGLLNTAGLKTLKNARFPPRLKELTITSSKVTVADFQYVPTAVQQFIITTSPIGNLDRVPIPSAASTFACQNCGIKVVRGVKWPSTLTHLLLTDDVISTFEVRQSDVEVLQQLEHFVGTISQTTCANSGELKEIKGLKVCVISDTAFESLYGSNASPSNGSNGGTTSTSKPTDDSKDSSSGGSKSNEGGSATISPSKTTSQAGSGGGSLQEATGGAFVGGGSLNTSISPAVGPSAKPTQDAPIGGTAGDGGSVSSSSLIVIILSCALSLAIAAVLYQAFVAQKRRKQNTSTATPPPDKFEPANTPSTASDSKEKATEWSVPTAGSLAIDFQTDTAFVRWRIDQVHIGQQIARGGYGIVYRGSYHGRVVAIKQMLPDGWRSDSMIAAFLDEIRLCARLEHPKIVSFIGVSWTSLRDLSVVSEFMAGGDLYSILRKYPEASGREWSSAWSRERLRAKTLIAMDIAEAVVYLHSFDSPIIHRDLKAKNVLLDVVGNAKLSDFGISRTVSIDETMTSEIGTAAWIAPEVLRGERYSEKADIYSLGVLLVELDRCRHPYADEPVLLMGSSTRGDVGRGNTSHVAHKNTQIAVLVSTGKLKPSPSRGCPDAVSTLIGRCLGFEADDRPTAMEVFYELRQIRKKDEGGYMVV